MQIVMVPIIKKETDRDEVMAAIEKLYAAAAQAGLRCKLDASADKTPGWKFNHYEMKVIHLTLFCQLGLQWVAAHAMSCKVAYKQDTSALPWQASPKHYV